MCCASRTNTKRKQTAKRTIALAFLICFILVSLLSEAFIITHANHEHDHDGAGGTCSTCAHIQSAENLLKQLGTASLIAALYMRRSKRCLYQVHRKFKLPPERISRINGTDEVHMGLSIRQRLLQMNNRLKTAGNSS